MTTAITSRDVVGEMLTELFCEYSAGACTASGRAAASRRLLRAGPADDEYSEGRLGGSQPRRVLAAAGSLHAPRRRSGAALAGAPRRALRCRDARADRRGACAFAQCARLHIAHSRQRGRNPPFLSVGHRSRGADAAKDRQESRLHRRLASEDLALRGGHDAFADGSLGAQRLAAAQAVRASCPRSAARAARRGAPPTARSAGCRASVGRAILPRTQHVTERARRRSYGSSGT